MRQFLNISKRLVLPVRGLSSGYDTLPSSSSSPLYRYIQECDRRSLVKNAHPSDLLSSFERQLKSLPSVVYAGFDPTADSLHIGNLLVLLNLLRSANFGVQPIAVVGGSTAAIGDPSGRDTERDEIHKDAVQSNRDAIRDQISSIARNARKVDDPQLIVVDNYDWFSKMKMVDYLRACKQMRVGEMLRMGAIKSRMSDNSGISFTEFSYQTMQAYDWKVLAEKYKCFFQIGGSDQLGHLDFGSHFLKRTLGCDFAAGLSLPLVTDSAGNKLGKSVGGGVWLSAKRTSPFNFYQFFRQLHDTEAELMIISFSLRPLEEVYALIKDHKSNLGKWIAQEALAAELTTIVHGEKGLNTALQCSRALFHGSIEDVKSLDSETLLSLFGTVTEVSRACVSTVGNLADLTRNDRQKGSVLMTKGAFKLNGEKVTTPDQPLDFSAIILPQTDNLSLVCWGKRKFQLVRWV